MMVAIAAPATFNLQIPHWSDSLQKCINNIKNRETN